MKLGYEIIFTAYIEHCKIFPTVVWNQNPMLHNGLKKKKRGGGGVLHIVLFLKSTYQRIYDLHIKYTTFGEL